MDVDPEEYRREAHNFGLNLINIVNPQPTAPNLWGVGGRGWMQAFLDPERIVDKNFFGYLDSPFVEGDMVSFIQDAHGEDLSGEERATVEQAFSDISVALWLEAGTTQLVHPDAMPELTEAATRGRELITGGLAEVLASGTSCVDCHKFHDAGDLGSAPDLTGYMSRDWLLAFIRNPASERFYGANNDRMPAFAPHDDPQLNQLDDHSLGLIVDWLRGNWGIPKSVTAPQAE